MKLLWPLLVNASGTFSGAAILPEDKYPINESAFLIEWSAGTTAGSVVIETAPTADYGGAWALIGSITWSGANKVDNYQHTGAYGFIRARTVGVTGGNGVSVGLWGPG